MSLSSRLTAEAHLRRIERGNGRKRQLHACIQQSQNTVVVGIVRVDSRKTPVKRQRLGIAALGEQCTGIELRIPPVGGVGTIYPRSQSGGTLRIAPRGRELREAVQRRRVGRILGYGLPPQPLGEQRVAGDVERFDTVYIKIRKTQRVGVFDTSITVRR